MVMSEKKDTQLSSFGEEGVYTKDFFEETKALKRVSVGVLFCEAGKQRKEYSLSFFTLFFIIGSLILNFYLLIKYTSADFYDPKLVPFLIQSCITVMFLVFGILIHVSFVNRKVKIESFNTVTLLSIGIGAGIGILLLAFQTIVKTFFIIKFSLSPYEYLFFFLTVAVSEEMFWRFGIQPSLKVLFHFTLYKKQKTEEYTIKKMDYQNTELLSSIIAITLTSGLFMLFHIFRYTDVTDLFIVLVMGIVFGTVLEVMDKRIDVPIAIHFVVNLVAGIQLVNQFFGGF